MVFICVKINTIGRVLIAEPIWILANDVIVKKVAPRTLTITNPLREGMIRMFCPNMSQRTFVCLDDISCHIEEFNNVIYNPNTDGIPERVDKLFRIIKERFDVELTSEQLIHLTKYESYQLEEFVDELKKYINAKK